VVVPVEPARGDVLVPAAEDPALVDRGAGAARPTLHVVQLELVGRAADAAVLEGPGTASAIALPDGTPDLGRDVAAARAPLLTLRWRRLRADPAPLRVALQDEVETDLEDGLFRSARVGMRQRIPRRRELVEEPPGNGDVEPAPLRGERLDLRPLPVRGSRRGREARLDRSRFFRKNLDRRCRQERRGRVRRGTLRRDDGADRRRRGGSDLRDDLLRLALRQVEEAGQDFGAVLRR